MEELDALLGAVRQLARDLLRDARERMIAGADVQRIHEHYVARTFEFLEEAETRAILAAGGERDALRPIEQTLAALEELQAELRREFPDTATKT